MSNPDSTEPTGPEPTDEDLAAVEAQLGRAPRGVVQVAHRCGCGAPDVVMTSPRLPDGTPFPTVFYLTCPRVTGAIGTLEASGVMKQMQARLSEDEDLAAAYRAAHDHYVATRESLGSVPEIAGISAGGMPDRVKCLHVLVGHTLAGGANPFGEEALAMLAEAGATPQGCWGGTGPCWESGA